VFDFPFPVGDPAGMRALAAQLHAAAGDLDGRTARAAGAVRSLAFDGPKAERFRDHATMAHARTRSLSGEMSELATVLLAAASRVEQDIATWHARRAAFLAQERSG
jgi:hypothetical protein